MKFNEAIKYLDEGKTWNKIKKFFKDKLTIKDIKKLPKLPTDNEYKDIFDKADKIGMAVHGIGADGGGSDTTKIYLELYKKSDKNLTTPFQYVYKDGKLTPNKINEFLGE